MLERGVKVIGIGPFRMLSPMTSGDLRREKREEVREYHSKYAKREIEEVNN